MATSIISGLISQCILNQGSRNVTLTDASGHLTGASNDLSTIGSIRPTILDELSQPRHDGFNGPKFPEAIGTTAC